MRIGLYLQDYRFNTIKEFESKMDVVKKQNLDLLVFPETGYTPDNHIFYCNDIDSDEDRKRNQCCVGFEREIRLCCYFGCRRFLWYDI